MIVRACPTGCIEGRGLTHEMGVKQSAVFPHHILGLFFFKWGTTNWDRPLVVCRVLNSDGTNHWVGQIDETDHLWMCGISNVPPLLWCNDSFKSRPNWRWEGTLQVACRRGGFTVFFWRWQRGALASCCVKLSFISEFRSILFHFVDAFWNQKFWEDDWFFFFFVIGTKELDHASKGNQFCLFVECPFLTSLLCCITSFCPFCHSFPSFVHFPAPPQYWFGYSEYHFVLLLSFPFLTKLSYRDARWDVSHLTWSLWTNLSRTVGRVGIVLVSLGFVFV